MTLTVSITLFLIGQFTSYYYSFIKEDLFKILIGVVISVCGIYVGLIYEHGQAEYQIELLNQEDVVIKTEQSLDTISFDSVEEYILRDNL